MVSAFSFPSFASNPMLIGHLIC